MASANSKRQLQLAEQHIVLRPVNSLKPDPQNARIHSERQLKVLQKAVVATRHMRAIVIDRHDQIVSGHARWDVAQRLGLENVPTIRVEHLTPDRLKMLQIADNRIPELASWNDEQLGEALKELVTAELDFDIEATGFTMGEIDLRIESSTDPKATDPADNFVPATGPAVSELGDLWQLDAHRLICESSLESATYELLMGRRRAGMVFTDPPYNVRINGHAGGKGRIKHREFAMASGEMSEAEFIGFLTTALGLLARYSRDGSLHFIFSDWRHAWEFLSAGRTAYTELKTLCIWNKDRGGLGSLYRSQHELVFVFKHGTATHTNNIELGRHGRNRTNVWTYPSILSMRHGEEGDLLAKHPTCKPIRLVADALLDCSRRGDIVLDAFLGSGTTLIAAQRVGRICYAIELDPLYVDTALRRWQADTGQDAILTATGQTFTEVEQQRLPTGKSRRVRHG